MNKPINITLCVLLSLVTACSWGGLIAWFYPSVGIWVGGVLFLVCSVFLVCGYRNYQEPTIEHKRRFND